MPQTRTKIINRHGVQLSARVDLPADGVPVGFAILAHCFTCSKDLGSLRRLSRKITDFGIGVLSFDFTGLGRSQGEFSDTGFSSQATDIEDAAHWLSEHYAPATILIGHSLGGTATLYAARNLESVQAVATIGSPSDPSHVAKLFSEDVDTIRHDGAAEVSIGGRPFTIKRAFLDDIEQHPPTEWIADIKKALLILHSPIDTTVGIRNAEEIFRLARHPKSFVSLRTADHLMSNPEDAEYAGQIIGAWAETFVKQPDDRGIATNQTVAARIGRDTYTTQIRAGRHTLVADEPASVGGKDLGGNPYDFLLAALGACTVMTLRMYADRKQWPLESATVHLSHEKVHETDVRSCEAAEAERDPSKPVKIDRIARSLELEGELDDEQRARLLQIADRCPVHQTLTTRTIVETTLL